MQEHRKCEKNKTILYPEGKLTALVTESKGNENPKQISIKPKQNIYKKFQKKKKIIRILKETQDS